jgi:alkyl hydroperoxide reductase subunit AhpC
MVEPTKIAPDFSTDALYLGNKISVTLSNYFDDWVILFFYSSDFTFV